MRLGIGIAHNKIGKRTEEVVCHFLCGGIDQSASDLGKLATNRRVDGITELGAFGGVAECNVSSTFRKCGRTARSFAGDGISVRRIDI